MPETLNKTNPPAYIDPEAFNLAIGDKTFRREMVKRYGFQMFCLIYLSHYFDLAPSDFAPELIQNLDDDQIDALLVIGFRGSAKSTLGVTAYAIYAALEKPHLYPFIVIFLSTSQLASSTIAGIKKEFEENELLKEDYGVPVFEKVKGMSWEVRNKLESRKEWQQQNLILTTGIRILARSRGQRVRGIRHNMHRIKLAIGDDIDDLKSVLTQEARNKTAQWWRGEVIGALANNARRILIGNWLHLDGLMARMKASGRYKVLEYPLLYPGNGPEVERCTWKAKFPTQRKIDEAKKDMGDIDFRREMLLQVIPEGGQILTENDIHYYDSQPYDSGNFLAHGVDLAISKEQTADYTAVVTAEVTWSNGGALEMFIQPEPVNERLGFHEAINRFDDMRRSPHLSLLREFKGEQLAANETIRNGMVYAAIQMDHIFFVEDVMFQRAAIEEMDRRAFAVTRVRPLRDKRARFTVAARYIKNGTVKFPRTGCEELISQLLWFGSESHDDGLDALTNVVLGVVNDGIEQGVIKFV